MLTLIATPIGNLADLSYRAVTALQAADGILCEDTRHSSILLKAYNIQKPLLAHHKFNERKELEFILQKLRRGESWALISDAGTPCINDPGALLVQACIAEGLPFTAVPGPCSPILALILSGFETTRFQCLGFLPKSGSDALLRSAMNYPGTTVLLESPHRLVETLEMLAELDEGRLVAVAREMTKTFEECKRGSVTEVLQHYRTAGVRGEVCLVIAGGKLPEEKMPVEELVELLVELHGASMKEAVKLAAKLLGRKKSDVYRDVHT